jgi:hypothetical protein
MKPAGLTCRTIDILGMTSPCATRGTAGAEWGCASRGVSGPGSSAEEELHENQQGHEGAMPRFETDNFTLHIAPSLAAVVGR